MELCELNPCLRYVQKRTIKQSYREPALAYDHRLFYLLSGELIIEANDREYTLTADTVLLIPPGTPYQPMLENNTTTDFYILNFDMDFAHRDTPPRRPDPQRNFDPEHIISQKAPQELCGVRFFEAPPLAREQITRIHACHQKAASYAAEECGTLLRLLFLSLLRNELTQKSNIPPVVVRLLNYIDEHYDMPLSNMTLAKEFQYHPNHLGRLCREATGMSLHHHVIDRRLRAAKDLLSNTDFGIEEIARRVGFDSPSYFSKYFRSKFGLSPYAWREKNKTWIL